jgi:hypothetical protein
VVSKVNPYKAMILGGFQSGILWFRVGVTYGHDLDSVIDAIRSINYNEFNGVKVSAALKRIAANGQIKMIWFGREYSPVIYIHIKPYAKDDVETTINVFRKLGADEVGAERDASEDEFVVRAWWD